MATITFTFLDNGVSLALPYELSQADFDRIVAWWRKSYPNADGTQPNRKEGARRATKAVIQGWVDGSTRDEKIKAASGAADAVPPIDVTEPAPTES